MNLYLSQAWDPTRNMDFVGLRQSAQELIDSLVWDLLQFLGVHSFGFYHGSSPRSASWEQFEGQVGLMRRSASSSLASWIPKFAKSKVLVVGDLMLDEFVWGKVSRISPEAPVPVVWVESESMMPGGAANVAGNIRTLGGSVIVAGVVGNDRLGEVLLGELALRHIDAGCVLKIDRPTTVKTRVIAHHQQVVRVDREHSEPMPAWLVQKLLDHIAAHIEEVDAVIIEDYGKGLITRRLLQALVPLARKHRKVITVDPKEEHFDLYHRVSALTPNRSEAEEALGTPLRAPADFRRAGSLLRKKAQSDAVLLTLGEDGMCLTEKSGKCTLIPTVAQEVFDVAGAGDTVIAAFTLALASGASFVQAAQLSNYAAGVVVGKLGVGSVDPKELKAKILQRSRMPVTLRK